MLVLALVAIGYLARQRQGGSGVIRQYRKPTPPDWPAARCCNHVRSSRRVPTSHFSERRSGPINDRRKSPRGRLRPPPKALHHRRIR